MSVSRKFELTLVKCLSSHHGEMDIGTLGSKCPPPKNLPETFKEFLANRPHLFYVTQTSVILTINPFAIYRNLYFAIINYVQSCPGGATYKNLTELIKQPYFNVHSPSLFYVCIGQRGVSEYLASILVQHADGKYHLPERIVVSPKELKFQLVKFVEANPDGRTYEEIKSFIKQPDFGIISNSNFSTFIHERGILAFLEGNCADAICLSPLSGRYTLVPPGFSPTSSLQSENNLMSTNINSVFTFDVSNPAKTVQDFTFDFSSGAAQSETLKLDTFSIGSTNYATLDQVIKRNDDYPELFSPVKGGGIVRPITASPIELQQKTVQHQQSSYQFESKQNFKPPYSVTRLPHSTSDYRYSSQVELNPQQGNKYAEQTRFTGTVDGLFDQTTPHHPFYQMNTSNSTNNANTFFFSSQNKAKTASYNKDVRGLPNQRTQLFHTQQNRFNDEFNRNKGRSSEENMFVKEWLRRLFQDHGEEFISEASNIFLHEGFVIVDDLVNAMNSGILTHQFLGRLGFRTGHIVRILGALQKYLRPY